MTDRLRDFMRRTLSSRLGDEQGMTLILALGLMIILTVVTGAVVKELVLNTAGTKRETKVLTALQTAESEMNFAMNWVNVHDTTSVVQPVGTYYPTQSATCPTNSAKLDGTHCYWTKDRVTGASSSTSGWYAVKMDANTCKTQYNVQTSSGTAIVCWIVDGRSAVGTTTREVQTALTTWNDQSTQTSSTTTSFQPTTVYSTVTATGATTITGTTYTTSTQQSQNLAAWVGAYASGGTSTCVNISGGVVVTESVLTPYDLCLSGTGTGVEQATGYPTSVYVGRNLYVNSGHIGCPTTPGCSDGNKNKITNLWAKNCYNGAYGTSSAISCNTPASSSWPVYYTNFPTSTPAFPSKPTVDTTWYTNAQPGPMHGCANGSVPFSFDNNTSRNNSVGTTDIWGGVSYTCTMRATNSTCTTTSAYACIKWNASTATFTISNNTTVFVDGNESHSSGAVTYNGRGTIYFDGTITMTKNFCAGTSTCSASAWDPNTNLLVLVALNQSGSPSPTDPTSVSVALSGNSTYQVACYANGKITESGGSALVGPMIADNMDLSGNSSYFVPLGSSGLPNGSPLTYNTSTSTSTIYSTTTAPVYSTGTVGALSTISYTSSTTYVIGEWGEWADSWRQLK